MSNNAPVDKVRDGTMEFSIFVNEGEKGPYTSVTFQNSYFDKQSNEFRPTNQINPSDLLKLSRLADKAYDAELSIRQDLKAERRQERSAFEESAAPQPTRQRRQSRSYSR